MLLRVRVNVGLGEVWDVERLWLKLCGRRRQHTLKVAFYCGCRKGFLMREGVVFCVVGGRFL